MKTINNKKFRALMDAAGMGDIELVKAEGFFFITSEGEHYDAIYSLESTMIYMNSFNQQTAEEWVEDIKRMLNK